MKNTGKKIIIAMSVLFYLSTVQAMTMLTPVGLDNSHCQFHSMTLSLQAADSLDHAEEPNSTHDDGSHCMACFAITDEGTSYFNNPQPMIDLRRPINGLHSIALNTLSPPPKSL